MIKTEAINTIKAETNGFKSPNKAAILANPVIIVAVPKAQHDTASTEAATHARVAPKPVFPSLSRSDFFSAIARAHMVRSILHMQNSIQPVVTPGASSILGRIDWDKPCIAAA